jgi:hypothetical protein
MLENTRTCQCVSHLPSSLNDVRDRKKWLPVHSCRSHWQDPPTERSVVDIGLALAVVGNDTGVVIEDSLNRMAGVFCSCDPPRIRPRVFSNIIYDSDLQPGVWIIQCLPLSVARTHSPRHRSLLENNLVVLNLATGNCVLVKTLCLNFIAVRTFSHNVRISHLCERCVRRSCSAHQGLGLRRNTHITLYTEQQHVWAWERKVWCKMDRSFKMKCPRTNPYLHRLFTVFCA